MKNIFIATIFAAIISSLLLTSCSTNKKTQASKAPVKNIKTDTVEVARENNRSTTISKSDKETIVAVPPIQIGQTFSRDHSEASGISWAKETTAADTHTNDLNKNTYTVTYKENDKNNWLTYSESGVIVEERHEILIDQLPQNIYNSIKNEYPNSTILSASTYKHVKSEGTYAVRIRPTKNEVESNERELIVRENGTFVP